MNKYAAAALVGEAERGRRVLVVSATWAHARDAFDDVAGAAAQTASRIDRAYSNWRVHFPSGGRILFDSAHRTIAARVGVDLVFVDGDAETANPHITERYWPCIADSSAGEIVRA